MGGFIKNMRCEGSRQVFWVLTTCSDVEG